MGPPSGYLKSFVLSFLFFPFFSFLFFIFFFPLSLGGPFSYRAPGHCPPMPPSRYATAVTTDKSLCSLSFQSNCSIKMIESMRWLIDPFELINETSTYISVNVIYSHNRLTNKRVFVIFILVEIAFIIRLWREDNPFCFMSFLWLSIT